MSIWFHGDYQDHKLVGVTPSHLHEVHGHFLVAGWARELVKRCQALGDDDVIEAGASHCLVQCRSPVLDA